MAIGIDLVSILIPAYNVADIVGRAVRSALSQTYQNLEILLVDDASRDETRSVAEDIAALDPRLRILHSDSNGGPGNARNIGLDAARGKWVAVLDADDALERDRLRRLIEIAELGVLDVVADNLELVDPGSQELIGKAFPLEEQARVHLTPEIFAANTVPGGRVMLGWAKPIVRRQFLIESHVRWRALRHAEDFLFFMELLLHGAKAELIGSGGYLYTLRRSPINGMPSPYTRAERSVADQDKAVSLLLDNYGTVITPRLRSLLVARPDETAVTASALALLDALRKGRLRDAIRSAGSIFSNPSPLVRCLNARYGIGSRRVKH